MVEFIACGQLIHAKECVCTGNELGVEANLREAEGIAT
jgi:hypothetical protein